MVGGYGKMHMETCVRDDDDDDGDDADGDADADYVFVVGLPRKAMRCLTWLQCSDAKP
jgi:hypothetical protein